MYLRYYGLTHYPFAVTPDPGFLYLSASHRDALGHLLYGAGEHGGFVALIGEVGTGKTTLIRALVDNDMPDLDIALCWNPHLGVNEFVATICDELGVSYHPAIDTSLKSLVDRLNQHLLKVHAANRRTVLIVDEAQNLSRDVLEQLRLLTNLETHTDKLLRIILVGQPELAELLARRDLRQLAQRITARFRLRPLRRRETRAYVQHRMDRAGGPQYLFTPTATRVLGRMTGGVPRLINMVCERALMGGYAHSRSRIGAWMIYRAARETLPRRARSPWLRVVLPTGALAVIAVVVGLALLPNIPLTRAAEWIQARSAAIAGDPANEHTAADKTGTADAADPASAEAKTDATAAKTATTQNPKKASAAAPTTNTSLRTDPVRLAAAADSASDADTSAAGAGDPSGAGKASTEIPDGDADINQVLRLWGVFGAQVHSRCSELHVGDLRCLTDRGSFSMLARFNRPALLTLQRGDKRQTVLLSSIDGNQVTLMGSNGTHQVPRTRLLKVWNGEFQVVWRSDSGVGLIQPGSVGDAVVWLRRRLAKVDGKHPAARPGPASSIYDDALQARLKQFQQVHGLKADGMAGPRTQMMLNGAVLSPGSPALKRVAQNS